MKRTDHNRSGKFGGDSEHKGLTVCLNFMVQTEQMHGN